MVIPIGNWEGFADRNTYKKFYDRQPDIHREFREWLKGKDFNSVLEIGCGDGIYSRDLFKDKTYLGLDINGLAIREAEEQNTNKDHTFMKMDFCVQNPKEYMVIPKFDLVFNHNVIDHVYDIPKFIENCMEYSNKYVYITAYNGYWPKLDDHEYIKAEKENFYYNHVSLKKIHEQLNGFLYEIRTFRDRQTPVTNIIIYYENP